MSTKVAPIITMPGADQHQQRQPSKSTRHQYKESEATYLMMSDEDPFFDGSPASVSNTGGGGSAVAATAASEDHCLVDEFRCQTLLAPISTTAAPGRAMATPTGTNRLILNQINPMDDGRGEHQNNDYTTLVRHKYFDPPSQQQQQHQQQQQQASVSMNLPNMSDESSSKTGFLSMMDLSEVFDTTYEGATPSTPTSAALQSEPGSLLTPLHGVESTSGDEEDLWQLDTSSIGQDPRHQPQQQQRSMGMGAGETLLRRSDTPPLTLYNNSTPTTPNRSPYTTPSAGVMSPITTGECMDGMMSSGRNTPTSQITTDAVVGSVASSAASSLLRPGSVNAPSSLLVKQPVLYSAIGSLEQINTNSLRNLSKRYLAPSKDFCKLGGAQSILIPPANQQQQQQQQQRLGVASNMENNESSQHQQQRRRTLQTSNDAQNNNGNLRAQTEAATTSSNRSKNSTKLSGNQVFGVLKKNAIQKQSFNDDSVNSAHNSVEQSQQKIRSNLRSTTTTASSSGKTKHKSNKKVSYDTDVKAKKKHLKGPVEMFRPSSDAYTPRIERKSIKYRAAEARTPVQQMASPMGTLQRPNFRDALRRVAMIIHQHVVKIEGRFDGQSDTKLATDDGLFKASMRDLFNEDSYCTPTYKCTMVRIPMARPSMTYGLRKIRVMHEIPSETEIYEFAHQLFNSVQLSSECSIVCLIYVERLMEVAKVPLLACTWRPIFMCGLLLASKVWQDLSSWNIEFASVYPQFSLEAINRLELNFLRNVKWDLYISSSCYAKYYFALRSLVEKQDFRQRYNRMVGGVDNVAQAEALKVQKRTEQVKEEALLQLSRSM